MTVILHDRIEKYGNERHLTVIFVSIDAVKKWPSLHISSQKAHYSGFPIWEADIETRVTWVG